MENKKALKKSSITIREATYEDIPALLELNRAAYSELTQEDSFWDVSHIRSHLKLFPQGQIVAEINGTIVGAAASLVVNMGNDPLRPHTWAGITDSGFFTNHDPYADTLYGADIYVHPKARSQGVGSALYDARKALCRRLNKRRIIAGGRLWNYHEYANTLTANEYVQKVIAGELKDLVLNFQLKQGFIVRKTMDYYLNDPLSLNHASFIEWLNPDYKATPTGNRKVRVACVQYKMRRVKSFAEFAKQVTYFVDVAANYNSDFVLLPELFTMQLLSISNATGTTPLESIKKLIEYSDRLTQLMRSLAQRFNMTIIAGSHPKSENGLIYNVSYICLPTGDIAEQPKLQITPSERRWWGITGGKSLKVIDTPKARIGVLICYDIEFPVPTRYLADEGAELIFVPFCTDNRQSYLRVRYCAQARAIENQIYVALAGNVGNLPDVTNMDIQYAQSAVLTPSDFEFARDGILAEAEPNEETVLICDLDFDDLHRTHSEGTVTPRLDRRYDLFKITPGFTSTK